MFQIQFASSMTSNGFVITRAGMCRFLKHCEILLLGTLALKSNEDIFHKATAAMMTIYRKEGFKEFFRTLKGLCSKLVSDRDKNMEKIIKNLGYDMTQQAKKTFSTILKSLVSTFNPYCYAVWHNETYYGEDEPSHPEFDEDYVVSQMSNSLESFASKYSVSKPKKARKEVEPNQKELGSVEPSQKELGSVEPNQNEKELGSKIN